ncbi:MULTISPECIES: hypothetical protein [unclassified Sphingobium]|uniref:hypothetical protein n=1 Tax=unclassified Sphingobium TaxID=2611147 RepID=UPI0035A6BA06
MSKQSLISKSFLVAALAIGCTPAFGANHLECMNLPMGEAEQTVLDRHRDTLRKESNLLAAVQASLQFRAQVCAYLNEWSSAATRLAFEHRWLQVQWGGIPPSFSASEEERLRVSLEPLRPKLIALFRVQTDAIAKGEEPPPPPLEDTMFEDFEVLLKLANIPQNTSNERRLDGWLYGVGFQEAVIAAFTGA